jgi:hypothetical protein
MPVARIAVGPPRGPREGCWGMPNYRIYVVGPDGHFLAGEYVVCADDQEATEKAKQAADGHDVELWERDGFIVRVLHKG